MDAATLSLRAIRIALRFARLDDVTRADLTRAATYETARIQSLSQKES